MMYLIRIDYESKLSSSPGPKHRAIARVQSTNILQRAVKLLGDERSEIYDISIEAHVNMDAPDYLIVKGEKP